MRSSQAPDARDVLLNHNTPGPCPECGSPHPRFNWATALVESWACACGAEWTIDVFVRGNPVIDSRVIYDDSDDGGYEPGSYFAHAMGKDD
jgi:hypothetical protein